MIVLFTDFGVSSVYTGQVKAVLYRDAPGVEVIDLLVDVPAHNVKAAAYLLEPFARSFPAGTVFLCVVDPGVGRSRRPGVLAADGRWYVGPDNGLFELVIRRATGTLRWWEVTWRPPRPSATFHGRDLFAPAAARLARGAAPPGTEQPIETIFRADWPDELAEVIYVDGFGNAMTGIRVASVSPAAQARIGTRLLPRATTFCEVSPGMPFWYENANGLMEIAVNQGRADAILSLRPGTIVDVCPA